MAGRVSIECPGCSAKLNLPDSSKLGKKIKCPKCAEVFVAKVADEAIDDLDDDEAPARSAGGKKRPSSGGKKPSAMKGRSSSGGGANVPLMAGGAVAAVLLIAAGLYFSGMFGGAKPLPAPPVAVIPPVAAPPEVKPPVVAPAITAAEKTLALRWMPTDTQLLLHAKISDLWQAPLLKGLVEMPQAAMIKTGLQTSWGLSPTDIETITVGLADLQELQTMVAATFMGIPVSPALPKMLVVVRTKKSLSLDELLRSLPVQSAEHNGKKYFESKKSGEPAGWIADPMTLIVAAPAELKAAMDRGETVAPRKELSVMDAASHVVIVFAPKDPKALSQGMEAPPVPGNPPEVLEMEKALKESFAAFGLGLSIRGGFDLQTSFALSNADGAKKVKAGVDKGIAEGRTQFEQFKATAQPLLGELGDLLLTNLKVDEQNQIVKVSTGIPDSAQQKLEQLPPLLMVMAATGGFGGGGLAGLFGGPENDPSMNPGIGPGTSPGGPPAIPGSFPINGDGKKPGETDAVDAEKADGLPDGVTLSVKMSWSDFPSFSADGTQSYPMQIMFDLKGEGISAIRGCGQITTKPMSVAGGGVLKVAKSQSIGAPDPTKVVIPFDADDPLNFGQHPEETLRVGFLVDPPSGAGTAIASLEGTFKFLTSDESEEITIENAAKTALRPLTDPALKAAGVKLLYTKQSNLAPESLTLSCGKGFFLGKAGASNAGDPSASGLTIYFNPEVDKAQLVQKLHPFDQSGKFPEKLQVNFKLFRGVKEQSVTFKFADVPLPSPESKPKI